MTPEPTNAYDWQGRTLKDRNGDKIGKGDTVYLDQQTDKPEWVLVTKGLFGTNSNSESSPRCRLVVRSTAKKASIPPPSNWV